MLIVIDGRPIDVSRGRGKFVVVEIDGDPNNILETTDPV